MLTQLIYVSRRKPNCTEAELSKILDACTKNNPELGVTGVLLYSGEKFLQYVEGEYGQLMPLYEKIKQDNRHDEVRLVSIGPIAKKTFPSWQMGAKQVAFDNMEFDSVITNEDKEIFQNVLSGKEEDGLRVINILQKVFK
ncbi:MAG TPA: bluf domain protein [Microscillaceae bacterium]|jgi:hypothetical protein|nr:bluf domain protein [Microscillaceae bacterium]